MSKSTNYCLQQRIQQHSDSFSRC